MEIGGDKGDGHRGQWVVRASHVVWAVAAMVAVAVAGGSSNSSGSNNGPGPLLQSQADNGDLGH